MASLYSFKQKTHKDEAGDDYNETNYIVDDKKGKTFKSSDFETIEKDWSETKVVNFECTFTVIVKK